MTRSSPAPGTLLGIFAKHWEPGKVKTRLARAVGESRAATLHALFVAALIDRLGAIADQRVIAFSPPESKAAFATVAGRGFTLWPQTTGDLGQRMEAFFTQALAVAERVVLIGSDSPDLPLGHLEQAFAALIERDVVLGPSADGGYCLLGAARGVPPVFVGIDWSTPNVWEQTVDRLKAAGIAWRELPPWYDVDELSDLESLRMRLAAASCQADPGLTKLAREIESLMMDQPVRPTTRPSKR